MNRAEFLKYLEKRLAVLNQKEREDIINEYTQHIEMKIKSGLTEEGAIKDFGDVSELANEILSAYNVDPNYKKSTIDTEKVEKTIHSGVGVVKNTFIKVKGIFNSVVDSIQPSSFNKTIKFLIKTFIILSVLVITLIIVGAAVFDIADEIYFIMPATMGLDEIIPFAMIVCYIGIAILIFIGVVCGLFKNRGRIIKKEIHQITSLQAYNENKTEKMNIGRRNIIDFAAVNFFWDFIKRIILLCVRIVALLFVVPAALFLIFTVLIMGTLIVFMFMGYPVIGLTIGCLGFNLSGISLFIVVLKYLYFTKYNNKEVEVDEK